MSKGQDVGYVRVSTLEQNEARQLDGLRLDRTFTDKASGRDVDRPQLQACLNYVRQGDTLIVHSMDRLARSVVDLRILVDKLTARGVQVRFVKESLTFTGDDSPMSKLLLGVMGAIAEFERDLLRERQREGIAIAKRDGKYTGRKRALDEDAMEDLADRVLAGESKTKLAHEYGISRGGVYAYCRRAKEARKQNVVAEDSADEAGS